MGEAGALLGQGNGAAWGIASPHFARIKADVLAIVAAIPAGRVTTFKAIGDHLDVMPRHVAYILATLSEPDVDIIPWHRVIPDNGTLGGAKQAHRRGRLEEEGCSFSTTHEMADFQRQFITVSDLQSGVPKQVRQVGEMS